MSSKFRQVGNKNKRSGSVDEGDLKNFHPYLGCTGSIDNNVLLVSTFGESLEIISKAIEKENSWAKHKICMRTTGNLPLMMDENRPNIDYIVFLIDITNLKSFEKFKKWIDYVDKEYFIQGKCCVIANGFKRVQHYAIPLSDLEDISNNIYDFPIFYTQLQEGDRNIGELTKKLIKHIEIASGHNGVPNVSPLLLRTLDRDIVPQTRREKKKASSD
eukprot:TRINITY_DN11369_c0_g1_i1.p1 TRINITY_DN11369_c0_g1~~TRINITY_DN11369_c0_g1_i1.p1  ORF type:complete len:216 (-),score=33.11 TRINITY_DN11369_c0_g1_i1:239-886(-)